MNSLLLLLALLCHSLPLLFRMLGASDAVSTADSTLHLSRASSIVMLIAYLSYLIFQLFTHRPLFEAQEVVHFNVLNKNNWNHIKLLKARFYRWTRKHETDTVWCNCSGIRRWRKWNIRRSTSDWILEWIYLAIWNDWCHLIAVWVCCRNNWGNLHHFHWGVHPCSFSNSHWLIISFIKAWLWSSLK